MTDLIKAKSKELLNAHKEYITKLDPIDALFTEGMPATQLAMIEFFRSFDEEFEASSMKRSELREAFGFTLEYREIAFG